MDTIICAVRGGEASRVTQERAIELARAGQKRLVFLYVVDTSTVREVSDSEAWAVRDELTWLGRVMLRMAQERAGRAGVKAETRIVHGLVRPAMESFLRQEKVSLFLMGAPRPDTASDVFKLDAVDQFGQTLENATGVKVEIVRQGP